MDRQGAHADWAFLPRWHFPERAENQLRADMEFASSFIKHFLDFPALYLMHLAVAVQTILVTIPDAQAPAALFEGIALLAARRTLLGRGPVFRSIGGFVIITLPFGRIAERDGAELLRGLRCTVLF